MFNQTEEKPGFWRRQFSDDVTSAQTAFDVIIGVIAPVLCFIFDPVVFNNRFGDVPLSLDLYRFKLLVYLFSGLAILTLSLWLILKERSGSLSAVFAGILLSGAVCSLLIGIVILPLSMIGLLFLIGILGFTPFLVFFVYLRNAARAFNTAKRLVQQSQIMGLVLLGVLVVSSPPALLQWQISRLVTQSMNDLLRGDVHTAESATERLRYVAWAADMDQVVVAYSRETDETRRATLAKAYQEITGKDITTRSLGLLD